MRRYKTIELIIDDKPWKPSKQLMPTPKQVVGIRIAYGEIELARRVKKVGGTWNRQRKLWELSYFKVKALGLHDRMVKNGYI